jgi:hypothetical protein
MYVLNQYRDAWPIGKENSNFELFTSLSFSSGQQEEECARRELELEGTMILVLG